VSLDMARKVADAVLYEGYVLYPYRAFAAKNQVRWQFGIVAPRPYSEAGGTEPWAMQTECLVEPGDDTVLTIKIRCLQLQARTFEEALDADGQSFRLVPSMDVAGQRLVTCDEGVEREIDLPGIPLSEVLDGELLVPMGLEAGREVEMVRGNEGEVAGRIVRERWPVAGLARLSGEAVGQVVRVRVRIENLGLGYEARGSDDRNQALRHSLVGAHTLLAVRDGAFVSLLDPPEWAAEAVASCVNLHTWPVLVGEAGRRDVMLSSPIILCDYPQVAPESPGNLGDATEIDEILTRGTDERARQVNDEADALPREMSGKLHGANRYLKSAGLNFSLDPEADAAPSEASVTIGGIPVSKGSHVWLRPSRRADTMEMFLAGRPALVEGVYRDVDDEAYVAVSLEGADIGDPETPYGRFLYFYPDEIEPLDVVAEPPTHDQRRAQP
jgi:hypothetical protein